MLTKLNPVPTVPLTRSRLCC